MDKTWTGAVLKENGKKLFKKNYWVCVGVSLIIVLLSGTWLISGLTNVDSGISIVKDIQEIRELNSNYNNEDYDDSEDVSEESFLPSMSSSVLTVITFIGFFLKIFIFNVIEVGGKIFFIQNRSHTPTVGVVFDGFKNGRYMNIVETMFQRDLKVILWSLLLIFPGVVKYYEYLMVPYILAENPMMKSEDVLSLSRQMMNSEIGDAFILSVSFIGWEFLSILTCGLAGIFYVNPYYLATFTELYAFNKEKAFDNGYIAQE